MCKSVEVPFPPPLTSKETDLSQHDQMMGNPWLRHLEQVHELTHTRLFMFQQEEDPHPGFIGESLQRSEFFVGFHITCIIIPKFNIVEIIQVPVGFSHVLENSLPLLRAGRSANPRFSSKEPSFVYGTLYERILIYSITQGEMMKTSADLKAEILVALAHPNRIRIIELLRKDVMCNCELAPALDLEQSNLSRHLKILVRTGVLKSWKDGLRVNFKVADQRILKILDLAAAIARQEVEMKAEALEV